MENLCLKETPSQNMKRTKQTVRSKVEDASENSYKAMKEKLAKKLLEMEALHRVICEEQNRLTEENEKLSKELASLKEGNTKTIALKEQEMEGLKEEVNLYCGKLERNVNEVEILVRKNKELEQKNNEILERDCELNKQLSELQEKVTIKNKIISMKTSLIESKQKDIAMLKEKTEQLLDIYEKSMKSELKNINSLCSLICHQPSSDEEAETTV